VTGQHRRLLDEVMGLFGMVPDHDLDLLRARQTLTHITTRVLEGLEPLLARHQPDVVLAQGDTTTTFAAALAAFYQRIPVAHVEAGLRSGDPRSPYPEEVNRRLTSRLATLHLAPTDKARDNLLAEGVARERVVVTGNTVIDALHDVVRHRAVPPRGLEWLADDARRILLVTAHRRESWDGGLQAVATALRDVAARRDDLVVVFPIHPNPVVREQMTPVLAGLDNVHVVEPLGYAQFAWVLSRAHAVLTDSGGVQEEAPSLGVPVLLARATTERPEAVEAGAVRMVGADRTAVAEWLARLLDDPDEHARMARVVSPYGDGKAAARSVQALRHMLDGAPLPVEFTAGVAVRGGDR